MPNHTSARATLLLGLLTTILLAACGGTSTPSPSPEPTPRPTPTPIAAPVSTPEDAAALVIATNPRFAGTMPLTPDVIGASQWWTATPLPGGGYTIELTMGWGDCQAGCIERHVWTFEVDEHGAVELISETGDPIPSSLPG
jgi:hypothetical protein